eukprot:TRINITY_DN13863_c0_g1_i1.p1 TRINITY_DN13863_c0_g1~~TRINITY_DN13863_c0_g1_i1.p1  ORF type:complete len:507 (+),score=120.13 TRINITY_DN13863_c0_g1_i1:183-1703(+)
MDVGLLSARLSKFGVVGAGVISDPLATLQFVQAQEEAAKDSVAADAKTASASAPTVEANVVLRKDGELTREGVLATLAETVRVQGIVQQEVSALARKIVKEREKGERKKKRQSISFEEGHKRIEELSLPREPLEAEGHTEASFQKLLMSYENDAEVMDAASKLLHPAGKGDPRRARAITMDKIIEIHSFMVGEMQKVLQEFMQLSSEQRRSYSAKGCETTAELLVSIAVEQQLGVQCEDVEQAVCMYDEHLAGNAEFTRCTEQLANMMQLLIGAAQPRVEMSEFLQILKHMGETSAMAKAFAKQLYEDYRAKACDVAEAYHRFESFSDETTKSSDALNLPELSSVEMQLCYDEYRHKEEVRQAWDKAGAGNALAVQALMAGGSSQQKLPTDEKQPKGKKLKTSEIVEMQELMVDELKRTTDAVSAVVQSDSAKTSPWKSELVVQMVQALASAAVERRYGVSAEEMTMAGFQHASLLQRNERFLRATEKQQEILMRLPGLCGDGPGE